MNSENLLDSDNDYPEATKILSSLSQTKVPSDFEDKLFKVLIAPKQEKLSFVEGLFSPLGWVPSTAVLTVATVVLLIFTVNENMDTSNPFSEMPQIRTDIVEVNSSNTERTEALKESFFQENSEAISSPKSENLSSANHEWSAEVEPGSMTQNSQVITRELKGFKVLSSSKEEKRQIDSLRNAVFTSTQ